MASLGILIVFVGVLAGLGALIAVPVVLLRKSGSSAQWSCPACQGKFAGHAKFCPHCGQELA